MRRQVEVVVDESEDEKVRERKKEKGSSPLLAHLPSSRIDSGLSCKTSLSGGAEKGSGIWNEIHDDAKRKGHPLRGPLSRKILLLAYVLSYSRPRAAAGRAWVRLVR